MNLSSTDLNLLVVLHAMLDDPSVARVAERLNVTSPAISNALGRLRHQFGDPLFVRSGRGVVPTPKALEMKAQLSSAMLQLDELLSPEPRNPAETQRTLTLALPDSDQLTRLPRLVAELADRMPKAQLEVISIDTLLSRGGLAAGAANVAVAPEPAADPALSEHLYDERGVLVVRQGHPLLRKRTSADAYFSALRHVDVHVALGARGRGHRVAEAELERHAIRRNVAVTVPTFAAAAMVAAATDLVAGIPRSVHASLPTSPPLVELKRFTPPGLVFPMHLVWHERTAHDPVDQLFRSVIRETFA